MTNEDIDEAIAKLGPTSPKGPMGEQGAATDHSRDLGCTKANPWIGLPQPPLWPNTHLYEECLAVQATDEIVVTPEMRACGVAVYESAKDDFERSDLDAIYRAMAAVAPRDGLNWLVLVESMSEKAAELLARTAQLEADNAAKDMTIKSYRGRIGELRSYSHELAKEIDRRNNLDQESEAYQYLKRLFLHLAPQCCVLPDLLGVCTQVDNAIAGLKIDNAALVQTVERADSAIAERDEALSRVAQLESQMPHALKVIFGGGVDEMMRYDLGNALAVGERALAGIATLKAECAEAKMQIGRLTDANDNLVTTARELDDENTRLKSQAQYAEACLVRLDAVISERNTRVAELESQVRMLTADKTGDLPYHGPVETVPHPTEDGKMVRRAVPDPVHEQFHRAVEDVAAGNVIRPARDQMEKALADARAADDKALKPLRGLDGGGDRRRIGG